MNVRRVGIAVACLVYFAPLRVGAGTIPEIVARAKQGIIEIGAFDRRGNLLKTGTAFFISGDGFAVTNFHVIEGASYIIGLTASGARYPFEGVVSLPPSVDLAILKFSAIDAPYLVLGSSQSAVEGQKVLVIGNPSGLQGTVSDGLISAFRIDRSLIQITAPISPGSSGSPVLDEDGKVIGVAVSQLANGQNLNFAIPVEAVRAALWSAATQRAAMAPSAPTPPSARERAESRASTEEDFVLAERELNRVYRELRGRLDSSSQKQLQREEVLWLEERAKAAPRSDEFLALTQQRVKELREKLGEVGNRSR